jgi:rhodanese-related sulfurtransferase
MVLVDVREAHEYAAGHIPGAVSMPLSTFDPAVLPVAEGKQIVFACQAGKRSLAALQQARLAGSPNVAGHYPGGFAGWRAAGGDVAFD